jgi:hypothetical protein
MREKEGLIPSELSGYEDVVFDGYCNPLETLSHKSVGSVGLYDKDETSVKLSKLGNPLEKLYKVIDFEIFRAVLEENLLNREKKNNAGQKPYDLVHIPIVII